MISKKPNDPLAEVDRARTEAKNAGVPKHEVEQITGVRYREDGKRLVTQAATGCPAGDESWLEVSELPRAERRCHYLF